MGPENNLFKTNVQTIKYLLKKYFWKKDLILILVSLETSKGKSS